MNSWCEIRSPFQGFELSDGIVPGALPRAVIGRPVGALEHCTLAMRRDASVRWRDDDPTGWALTRVR